MAHAPPGGEGDVRHICLESSPPPMQSGCACRGQSDVQVLFCAGAGIPKWKVALAPCSGMRDWYVLPKRGPAMFCWASQFGKR